MNARVGRGPTVATLLGGRLPYAVGDGIRWLEHVGDPELGAILFALVPAADAGRRSELCAAIGRSAGGGELLVALARDADAEVRAAACIAIGRAPRMERELVVETVVVAFDDADPQVRSCAAFAAGRLRIHEAEEGLLRLAEVAEVGALEALAALRSERGFSLLLAEAGQDSPAQLRAIAALATYPPGDIVEEALLRVLGGTADPHVRAAVVAALAVVGGPASVEPVTALLRRDVRRLPKRERNALVRTLTPILARWRSP